jgi:hypothetical protein
VEGRRGGGARERWRLRLGWLGRWCAGKRHDDTVILLTTIVQGGEKIVASAVENIDDFDEDLFRAH